METLMRFPTRVLALMFLAGAAPGPAVAADAPKPGAEAVDRTQFLPNRKYQALAGKAVGVLALGDKALLGAEGRKGPDDVLYFSSGGNSYHWLYLPLKQRPLIGGLNIKVGSNGQTQRFDGLGLATPENLKLWDVNRPYTLVEIEVNGGRGSPAGENLVATRIRVLEDTEAFPFKTADVVAHLRKHYESWERTLAPAVEEGLRRQQVKALGDRRPTGPREKSDVFYISWLPESERLQVRWRTQVTDGAYQTTMVKEWFKPKVHAEWATRQKQVRHGTCFGVEYGLAYEVSAQGRVQPTQLLTPEGFQKEIPPPATPPRPAPGD
jgi:hypothetical protein